LHDCPLISVIVPIYKVEKYLDKCVASIVAQTYTNLEILLVEDGSPDRCPAMCDAWAEKDERIHVIHKKNGGLSDARNAGIDAARGEWLTFIDGDDYIVPEYCETLLMAAETTGAQIAVGNLWYAYPEDDGTMWLEVWPSSIRRPMQTFTGVESIDRFFEHGGIDLCVSWGKLYHRSIFCSPRRLRFPVGALHEDQFTTYKCYYEAERVVVVDTPLYYYVQRPGSIMAQYGPENIRWTLVYIRDYLTWYRRNAPEIAKTMQRAGMKHYFSVLQACIVRPACRPCLGMVSKAWKEVRVLVSKEAFAAFPRQMRWKCRLADFHLLAMLYRGKYVLRAALEASGLLPTAKRFVRRVLHFTRFFSSYISLYRRLRKLKAPLVLITTPQHGNLGDEAIVLAEDILLARLFPERPRIEIPTCLCQFIERWHLPISVAGDACIACHGGGNLGSLYATEEGTHRWIMRRFRRHRIFFFPQSIFFGDDTTGQAELAKSQTDYAAVRDLTILERDAVSYATGQRYFPTAKHRLVPDTVTVLDGWLPDTGAQRNGVCFFLRCDKEKVLKDDRIKALLAHCRVGGVTCSMSDTVIDATMTTMDERAHHVAAKLREAAAARLVITDRFHGAIFAIITHTPVLVFRSYDTKIASGIKWFKDLDWVHYAENMDLGAMEKIIDQYTKGPEHPTQGRSNCGNFVAAAVREVILGQKEKA